MAIFTQQNLADEKQADMYLLGSMPDMDEETYSVINTDVEFIDKFKQLEANYDRINIWINSPGGRVTDGMAMINTIRNSKKDVHTYNLGLAASMGAVLLLSGKTIHAPADSIIMLHAASGGVMGNKEEIRDYADMLEVYEKAMISIIASNSTQSEDQIKAAYFDGKDHFMTGQEAFAAGLITTVENYQVELPAGAQNMSFEQLNNHFNTNQTHKTMSLKDWFGASNSADKKETVTMAAVELNQLKTDAQAALAEIDVLNAAAVSMKQAFTDAQSTADKAVQELLDAQTAHATALAAAEAVTATVTAEFEAFKKGTGDDHTDANHDESFTGDDVTDGPVSQIRTEEAAAKAQGQKIFEKNQKTNNAK